MPLLASKHRQALAASLVGRYHHGLHHHLYYHHHHRRRAPAAATARLTARALFATSAPLASHTPWRSQSFSSGYSTSYDQGQATARGPIYTRGNVWGTPRFYPRDLKRKIDEYVVGQDRAKKIICSFVFNHYRAIQQRRYNDEQDRLVREKLERQEHRDFYERGAGSGDYNSSSGGSSSGSNNIHHGSHRHTSHTHQTEGPGVWDPTPHARPQHQQQQHQQQHQHDLRAADTDGEGDAFEGEFVRQHAKSVRNRYPRVEEAEDDTDDFLIKDEPGIPPHVKIDKSNLLLMGPTGVGKTYILQTISSNLSIPIAICDCNTLTQAGYVGQDVESCVERLLVQADYDVKRAEKGIIVLDEFDKLAKREMANTRDVSGEGVQQALLKLVEGSKVNISLKEPRAASSSSSSPPTSSSRTGMSGGGSSNSSSASGAYIPPSSSASSSKQPEHFTVDTTNILFVFCGAFVGLEKEVLRRLARRSIGFGADVRGAGAAGGKNALPTEMYAHLPHFPDLWNSSPGTPSAVSSSLSSLSSSASLSTAAALPKASSIGASPPTSNPSTNASPPSPPATTHGFTPLDLTSPADLQTFGFIPELIGRMHATCALAPLSLDELYRILTEPRSSLLAQFYALFETYPSHLRFTRRALRAVAERAAASGTGARALRFEMERVLAEPVFDAPIPYVLVTEACVRGREKALYWGKDGRLEMERLMREEDAAGEGEGGGRGEGAAGPEEARRAAEEGRGGRAGGEGGEGARPVEIRKQAGGAGA